MILLFTALLYTSVLQAQDQFVADYLEKWSNAKEYTTQVAEAMPADKYSFIPTENQRAFHEQMTHMCANMIWLSTTYLDGKGLESAQSEEPPTSKEEIMTLITESFDYVTETLESFDPDRLDEEIEFFAGPMTRRQGLYLMADHLAHHRGQAVVYLRLSGIDPPRYKGW